MARRIKFAAAVGLVVIAIPAGRWMRHTRPWETPTERAHRLCDTCGLDDDQIDQLMDEFGDPTLSREQALALFLDSFENPAAAEPCMPCVEAVMDATGQEAPREESQGEARTERG